MFSNDEAVMKSVLFLRINKVSHNEGSSLASPTHSLRPLYQLTLSAVLVLRTLKMFILGVVFTLPFEG